MKTLAAILAIYGVGYLFLSAVDALFKALGVG